MSRWPALALAVAMATGFGSSSAAEMEPEEAVGRDDAPTAGADAAANSGTTDADANSATTDGDAPADRERTTDRAPRPQMESLRGELLEAWSAATDALAAGQSASEPEARINAVARRAGRLAREADGVDARVAAATIELRGYHALVRLAMAERRPSEAGYHLLRLRRAVRATRQLDSDAATALAEYWSLAADLIDIQRTASDPREHERRAIDRLTEYLQQNPLAAGSGAVGGQRHAIDAAVTLMRLLDQAGRNESACALAERLDSLLGNDPRRAELAPVREACERLKATISLAVQTPDGETWHLQPQGGASVLVHVYDARTSPSAEVRAMLARATESGGEARVALVTVDLSGEGGVESTPGVVRLRGEAAVAVAEQLGVDRLPRYLLIGSDGRLAAIGTSVSILDRVERAGGRTRDEAGAGSPADPVESGEER